MWTDPITGSTKFEDYVKVTSTLNIESLIIAEWNMNDFEDLLAYGTYKWRPLDDENLQYYTLPRTFDLYDDGDYWSTADETYKTFAGFNDTNDEPVLFQSKDIDRDLYFSLKSCTELFRPRSGINKVLYFEGKYIDDIKTARRPRYYMSSRYDNFKYWNSFRKQKENDAERIVGISSTSNLPVTSSTDIGYFIEDTAPFVVYKNAVPANRIVVKMQTNLADSTSKRNIRTQDGTTIEDPLLNRAESSIPQRWGIDYLDQNNNWVRAIVFNELSTRRDGSPIVKWDGYVELYYGVIIPEDFRQHFHLVDFLISIDYLPVQGLQEGEAYIVGQTDTSSGTLYVWNSLAEDWYSEPATYGFSLYEDDDTKRIGILSSLTNPRNFLGRKTITFTDFTFIKGLRVSVNTMIAPDTTFNLIELSPRLKANVSDYASQFSFNKTIANDSTGLPVGSLVVSNGSIELFNHDGAFTENNQFKLINNQIVNQEGSLVSNYLKPNIKFDFYEAVLDVDGYDKFIPMKAMYAEQFPLVIGGMNTFSVSLRDQYFKLEREKAAPIFLQNVTVTTAVCILLDSIGFSNYIFLGFDEGYLFDGDNATNQSITDPVIPYFFVEPDISVAEVLNKIAASTQTAMFFDEYNNFVVMPKEWLLPKSGARATNITMYGQVENQTDGSSYLPNIISMDGTETKILNDGVITYSIRYIQKDIKYLSQSMYIDTDKVYVYKPTLLWEVGSNQDTKTKNESQKDGTGYSLGAATLNTTLSSDLPTVEYSADQRGRIIVNNTIDVGESIYWLPRFQGYLYANGEIIRYDAVEYDISGTGKVWIKNNIEYQKYFSSLPFNGKIYPTGIIRIYAEPFYEIPTRVDERGINFIGDPLPIFKVGPVKEHGRGQFNTEVTEHPAGLPSYWSDNNNVRGCLMKTKYIFSTTPTEKINYDADGFGNIASSVGSVTNLAQKSIRKGTIRNFMRNYVYDHRNPQEWERLTSTGTLQSSALVFHGPSDDTFSSVSSSSMYITNFPTQKIEDKKDYISYVFKEFTSAYRHFGTRMRIIGKLKVNGNEKQGPNDGATYFNIATESSSDKITITGGSGGIGIGVNPNTNVGYFFEICALTADDLEKYKKTNESGVVTSVLHNVIFYKVVPASNNKTAIAKKIWGGIAKIIVDDGQFTGQDRIGLQNNPTVYDIAIEYQDIGSSRKFYLYINNSLIADVIDSNPLPMAVNDKTTSCLFVRGSAECMFENFYALQNLQSSNSNATIVTDVRSDGQVQQNLPSPFGVDEIRSSDAMRKYSLPGFIKSTYLTDIASGSSSRYKMYFEEFGTIMRECAYFNIKYDQAYPALMAKLAPVFNSERGYSVSGFHAGSYTAEFLVFNTTDKAIVLDESTGNYLRIIGVTFTQDITSELKVDDYFSKISNFSDPLIINNELLSPSAARKQFDNIKTSRAKYGNNSFQLESRYIQSPDSAENIMQWLIDKTLKPRKIANISAFGVPHLQLGDIININYLLPEGVYFTDKTKQFVVFSIEYNRSGQSVNTNIKAVEI